MGFGMAMLLLGCHGLWRSNRAARQRIRHDDPKAAYYVFTEAIKRRIEARLLTRILKVA